MAEPDAAGRQRLDKWLWAARFYKTRSLAAAAIAAGHVRWNGQSAKPAREVAGDDEIEITVGEQRWTVRVRGLNPLRRPAPEARLLYEETAESQARRAGAEEMRRLAPVPGAGLKGRPTKRAGRLIRGFNE